jgi:predicted kinase
MIQTVAVILRAVPGSGKSTFARLLNEVAEKNGLTMSVRSTDDKHIIDGEYQFNMDNAHRFHKQNLEEFKSDLGEFNIVMCDNTNIKARDYRSYVDAAHGKGIKVVAVVFEPSTPEIHFGRNVHNVPMATIEKMHNALSLNIETKNVDDQYIIKQVDGEKDSVYQQCVIKAILGI